MQCCIIHIFQDFFPRSLKITKITEKVPLNIASEARYDYILSGQKFIKKCQKWYNLVSFWKPKACGQKELPDRSVLIGQKLVEIPEFKNSNATFWVIFKHCGVIKKVYPPVAYAYPFKETENVLWSHHKLPIIAFFLFSSSSLSDSQTQQSTAEKRTFDAFLKLFFSSSSELLLEERDFRTTLRSSIYRG